MSADLAASEINRLIPAEIKHDPFYRAICKLARGADVKTVLEIGSSAGEGSTEAFVKGLRQNPNGPLLFCMEVSRPRFTALCRRYAKDPFVRCYNVSSVAVDEFPDRDEVAGFYRGTRTNLNAFPLERVLGWLDQDIEYVRESGVAGDGIDLIKRENGIDCFDVVLIDGSEFTGKIELEKVYGAKYLLLDDINTYKNYDNFRRLSADPAYCLLANSYSVRNGFAIFRKAGCPGRRAEPSANLVERWLGSFKSWWAS
jgi:hypothetical protein